MHNLNKGNSLVNYSMCLMQSLILICLDKPQTSTYLSSHNLKTNKKLQKLNEDYYLLLAKVN